jgi:hypothetical protein
MREALEALVEVLVQKGMVTKDEVVAEFEKLDRKMKESRGKS